ncbi:MAG: CHAP domain-containing protein, partial [Clostridia bacterium]|nr:CHAP domain-containing protein [Clostridia bacterium]
GINYQREQNQIAMSDFDMLIEQKRKELQDAQNAGSRSFIQSKQAEITELENEKLRQQNIAQQLSDQSYNRALSTISSLPAEALSAMGEQGITSFFSSLGAEIDPLIASGLSASAKSILEDKKITDEEKMIRIKSLKQDLFNKSQTEADKVLANLNAIDKAVLNGSLTKEGADELKVQLGLSEKKMSPIDIQMKKAEINYKNAQTEEQKLKNLEIKNSLNDIYSAYGEENSINLLANLKSGDVAKRPAGRDQSFEGECSAFVNDISGLPAGYFSSSLESKMQKINKYANPKPGDVFISDLSSAGNYGHIGFIESVNDDGTFTIVDSNRYGNKEVNRRTVSKDSLYSKSGESVVGFYSPIQDIKKGIISKNGLTKEQEERFNRAMAGESTQVSKSMKEALANTVKSGGDVEEVIKEVERKKFLPRSEKIQNDFEKGVSDYEEILNKFKQMEVAYKQGQKIGDKTFSDQALINLFNKITDPNSVVRESEYDRTGKSLGLSDRIIGASIKVFKGGSGLTDETREAGISIANALMKGAKERFYTERAKAERKADGSGVPKDFLYSQLGLNDKGEFEVEDLEEAEEKKINLNDSFGLLKESIEFSKLGISERMDIQNEITRAIEFGEDIQSLKQELLDDGFDPNDFNFTGGI